MHYVRNDKTEQTDRLTPINGAAEKNNVFDNCYHYRDIQYEKNIHFES